MWEGVAEAGEGVECEARQILPRWASAVDRVEPGDVNNADVVAEATGWPMVAMFSHYELGPSNVQATGNNYFPIQSSRGIIISNVGDLDVRILPTRLLFPGFALNTLFYATLLWLLIPGPFTLRRFLRVRRGLCPKCAYPVGDSGVCSECGRELPRRVRVGT